MRKLVFIILLLTLAASAQKVKVGPTVGPLYNTLLVADIQAYGAVCDGVTDAAPALRAALAAVGTVTISKCQNGNPYIVASLDPTLWHGEQFVAWVGSNQTLKGAGGTLKIANGLLNGATGRSVFMSYLSNYTTFQDLNIDMNGANNLSLSLSQPYFEIAIQFVGSNHGKALNNTIINSAGRNAITVGSGYNTDGTFSDDMTISGNVIINGGTQLSGNTLQSDWSALYSEATNTIFDGNRVYGPQPATIPIAGGIEIHGSHTTVTSNYIQNSAPCMYISGIIVGLETTDVNISNNQCDSAEIGFSYFAMGSGTDFRRIHIQNNLITLKNGIAAGATAPNAFSTGFQSDGTWPSNTRITIHDSSITGNKVSGAGTASSDIMLLHSLDGFSVMDNNFADFPAFASAYFYANPDGINKLSVRGNTFTNVSPGQYGIYVTANSTDAHLVAWTLNTAMALSKFVTPTVKNGHTYEATTAGTTSGVEPTWPTVNGNTVTDGTVVWTCRGPWTISNLDIEGNTFIQTGTANAASVGIRSTLNSGTVTGRVARNTGIGQTASLSVSDTSATIDTTDLSTQIKVGANGTAYTQFQMKNGVTGCATAASAGATCTTVVTWPAAFADNGYIVGCLGSGLTSGVPLNGGLTARSTTTVTFQTVAGTAGAAQYTTIECTGWHP